MLTNDDGHSNSAYDPPVGWRYSNLRPTVEPAAAEGQVLIHIEATFGDCDMDSFNFTVDDTAGDVELLIKVLDQPQAPDHLEHFGWHLE